MAPTDTAIDDFEVGYWDAVAEEWSTDHPFSAWREHSDQVNRELLERWLTRPTMKRLLKTDLFDEATSQGLLPLLADKTEQLVGIDVSVKILARVARRQQAIDLVHADVRALPFSDDSLDGVVSLSTLDPFDSQDAIVRALGELGRVLRLDGELLLTLDNLDNPIVRLRNALPFRWLHRLGLVPYRVGTTCGRSKLKRWVEEAGFEVLETTAILHCPRVFAVPDANPARHSRLSPL